MRLLSDGQTLTHDQENSLVSRRTASHLQAWRREGRPAYNRGRGYPTQRKAGKHRDTFYGDFAEDIDWGGFPDILIGDDADYEIVA